MSMTHPPDPWASVFDAITDSVQVIDATGRYVYINAAARRILKRQGLDPETLIGQHVFRDVFPQHAADTDPAAIALRRALATNESTQLEHYYAPWDRWFAAHYYALPAGGVAILAHDVTDRKRTERALTQSQSHLQVIADSVPALISYVDRDLTYLFVNRSYTDWFGLPPESIVGRPMHDVLGEQAWQVVGPRMRAALAGETIEFEAEAPYERGGARWIHAVYTPHRDESGEVLGVVILVSDITARRHAEAALRDADRRKDEFLAILAHELRNPLAPIRTGLELLRLGGDQPAAVSRVRPMLERQVTHMVHLIDDLLDVSRIASGKIDLNRHPVALGEVISSAVDGNAAILDASGVELSVQLPEPPCYVDVDPTRFVQVVSNVLHNAAKFTPRGGRVEITGRILDDSHTRSLELLVRDTGIGMSAELVPRVFDLFVQGKGPQQDKGGLGIGLALARQLVELHGGRIEAHSEGLGRGSTVVIHMPVVATSRSAPRLEAPTAAAIRARVLIADDNADAAEMLAAFVAAKGGTPYVANSGSAALAIAADVRPNVILLDIGMPEMDGYETCRRLRREAHTRDALIVALTGWGQDQDRVRAKESGFNAHLTKPADLEALEKMLIAASG